MQDKEYIEILIQSLKKKLLLLNKLAVKNQDQKLMLEDENLTPEILEQNMNEKTDLITEINHLDEGFDEVYDRMKLILEKDRCQYRDEIAKMQDLIREIMAKDTAIQTEERRNYALAQKKFARVKKQIREVKASQKMVNRYYQNMMKQTYGSSQFMDSKK